MYVFDREQHDVLRRFDVTLICSLLGIILHTYIYYVTVEYTLIGYLNIELETDPS